MNRGVKHWQGKREDNIENFAIKEEQETSGFKKSEIYDTSSSTAGALRNKHGAKQCSALVHHRAPSPRHESWLWMR
jgi:hypothetical protein